jgi:hypothetical protein
MENALMTLTLISLAACAGCAVLTWRRVANDRRRSAARVAALAAAVQADDRVAGSLETHAVPVASLFDTKPGGLVSGRPFLKAAVAAALGLALVVFAAIATREHRSQSAPPGHPAPIELIAMTHTRDGNRLTVSGTVRNPKGGEPLTRIDAVVSAFDRTGSIATTGAAPLAFTTLQPGDESFFAVAVSGSAGISRYRVSFRTGTSLLRHVDRRARSQLAAAR